MAGVMARMIPAAFPLVEPGDTGALGEQMVYEALQRMPELIPTI